MMEMKLAVSVIVVLVWSSLLLQVEAVRLVRYNYCSAEYSAAIIIMYKPECGASCHGASMLQ